MKNRLSSLGVLATFAVLTGLATLLLVESPHVGMQAETALGGGYIGYNAEYSGQTFLASPDQEADSEPDLTGSVRGILVDDGDLPVRGLEVELISLDLIGDRRLYATQREWTNAQGEYRFPRASRGEYVLAVQKRAAPDGRHPFAGTYYPGVDTEASADRILVTSTTEAELHPMRLHRLGTVTLKVHVTFEDGSSPAWSNLLFHNPSFPYQGVIGDEAPGIEDGKGEFTLPVGFEYYARAKVDCDAGTRIETRESRPIERIRIENGHYPQELTFVIPGPACRLWTPK